MAGRGGRRALRLRVFAGPKPADALRRFTAATGRQPEPQAPWTFGPWFQTGQPNVDPARGGARRSSKTQRDAGVPVSVGRDADALPAVRRARGRQDAERARNAYFHARRALAPRLLQPVVCLTYREVYDRPRPPGCCSRPGGLPFDYPAFVGGSGPLGFTEEPLAQFDFTHPATEEFYAEPHRRGGRAGRRRLDGGLRRGRAHAGVVQHDGVDRRGDAQPLSDRLPLRAAAHRRALRPAAHPLPALGLDRRAACADVVWGGDPTTVWGFDGISSAVTQARRWALAASPRWGTDIGGYVSFGAGRREARATRTRRSPTSCSRAGWSSARCCRSCARSAAGIAVPSYPRPQVYDEKHIEDWRRLTELHTQLNPYLRAADEDYRRNGLPIVRHLVLAHPRSGKAQGADDEYLFGPDLLAAPVTEPEVTERRAWLPPGRWVEWWGSTEGRRRRLPARAPECSAATATAPSRPAGRAAAAAARRRRAAPARPRGGDAVAIFGRCGPGASGGPGSRAAAPRGAARQVEVAAAGWGCGEVSREVDGGWELRLRSAERMKYFEIEASLGALRGIVPAQVG